MKLRSLLPALLLATALLAHPRILETYVVLDGQIRNRSAIYAAQVAIAAAGIAAAFWSRRRVSSATSRSKPGFAITAAALSFVLALVLMEMALRLRPELALQGELLDEFRWRERQSHSTARSRTSGENCLFRPIAPSSQQMEPPEKPGGFVSYEFDLYDPELGWIPTPDYDRGGVRTNSQGIRADREFAAQPSPGIRRIVLIGDSFTWGESTWHEEIRNEDTFAAILEQMLPRAETINLGVHGWGTDQQLLYLRRLGLALHPDLVIVGFFEFDYERNGVSFYSYAKPAS